MCLSDDFNVKYLPLKDDCRRPVLMENIRCLKREAALAQVRNLVREVPEIGLDSIVHMIQNLSAAQRSEVAKAIGRLEAVDVCNTTVPSPVAAGPQDNNHSDANDSNSI